MTRQAGDAPPGLQHERTALAWDRTGLAFLVFGALLLRACDPPWHPLRHLPGALAMGAGVGLIVWAARRYRTQMGAGRTAPAPAAVRLVGVLTVVCSLGALLLVVAGG
jgi:uncharacterized membrane protein YidH (DUF202 family)